MGNYDPTDIRSQERAQADKDLRNKLAKDTEESDFRWLMGNKRGRRIVWRLLERTGIFRISFNTNAMTMAFSEGNRNEGLRTLTQIHALCPEFYHVMVCEATERNEVEEMNHDKRNNNDDGS